MHMGKYHFIGIGGIGMSALAHILLQRGAEVSGSDLRASPITEKLTSKGARIAIGQSADNIREGTTIVYSTDISTDNSEYQEAKRRGLLLLHRSELLGLIMRGSSSLLVTGTHGKTTTSSLLAHLLIHTGREPGFAIGGVVCSLGTNGAHGNGPYFVAEADESDGSFLQYPAYGAIITNCDNDHLAYWKTEEALLQGFKTFADRVESKEHLFWCADDAQLSSLKLQGISYGFSKSADFCINACAQEGWNLSFSCAFKDKVYRAIKIPMIGRHNVLNAAAVFGLGVQLNIPEERIRQAFMTFQGVKRRAEKKGETAGISFYDDYGHHPTEIAATLAAFKSAIGNRRLVVAFQPHRYTRTRDCLEQFPEAFSAADAMICTDIYSAGEAPIVGITTEHLLEKIQKRCPAPTTYVARATLPIYLAGHLREGDVLVTMGAGDITKICPEVVEILDGSDRR